LLLLTGVLNAFVAVYIYSLVPEFLLRFIAWLLIHVVYRLDRRGIENIPEEGPALLICNHVSFADAIVISAACPRPIRFIMESSIFRIPVLSTIFRGMKAIPVGARQGRPGTCTSAPSSWWLPSCATAISFVSFRKAGSRPMARSASSAPA
jgi:1-acyl-sn-glycerol-3-phosphate acyltransferase